MKSCSCNSSSAALPYQGEGADMHMQVKNTFLHWSLADEDQFGSIDSFTRAQSEPARGRPSLDSLLASSEAASVIQIPVESASQDTADTSTSGPSDAELRQLQRRIAETSMSSLQKNKRIQSSGSVSTMAPPDLMSDCEDASFAAMVSNMPKVSSSGSVSSMASYVCFEEAPEEERGQAPSLLHSAVGPILEEESCGNRPYQGPRVASARDGSKAEFCHNLVPKTLDLAKEFSKTAAQGPPTTLMIRHIPNRYTQREFIRELDGLGFSDTFDFLYLPMDKGTQCNVGYAFVNFIDPRWALRCMEVFQGYVFVKYRKSKNKIAAVSIAHIQGFEANVRYYENTAVNTAVRTRQQRGPLIIPGGGRSLVDCA
eukprot:TRINITY_DN14786_c0_g1_i1.p1 TRINITY_DN14786_c0_g1~~TRINITY_DN14786_c0_g1_i1.p1  ORF type:complete len:387 (+),score=74.87 TRINITY_DN14786_c0_g1_i1:54-1163(+)